MIKLIKRIKVILIVPYNRSCPIGIWLFQMEIIMEKLVRTPALLLLLEQ